MSIPQLLEVLTFASEFEELPVRHNEDELNLQLSKQCKIPLPASTMESPHTKAHLLLQAHFSRLKLPIADYKTDTKSVLDQCVRVLQAMVDVAANAGYLDSAINCVHMIQMVIQGRWHSDSSLLTLPGLTVAHIDALERSATPLFCLPQLIDAVSSNRSAVKGVLKGIIGSTLSANIISCTEALPLLDVSLELNVRSSTHSINTQQSLPPLQCDEDYGLRVLLKRGHHKRSSKPGRAFASAFPKPVDESHLILVGNDDTQELVALKRLGPVISSTSTFISFYTPQDEGTYTYTVYVLSGAYLGLDQQYSFTVKCTQPVIEAASTSPSPALTGQKVVLNDALPLFKT
jgi:activating signal cointegrator complex subunit 3